MKFHVFTLFLFLCSTYICLGQNLKKYFPKDYCTKKVVFLQESIEIRKQQLEKAFANSPNFEASIAPHTYEQAMDDAIGDLDDQLFTVEELIRKVHKEHSDFHFVSELSSYDSTYRLEVEILPRVYKVPLIGWVYERTNSYSLYLGDELLLKNLSIREIKKQINRNCK